MNGDKTKYLELYEALREGIVSGAWAYGARLPSRRQMAQERGLSVVTVDHSYDLLCQEGYIEPRARSGYFVIYRSGDGFARSEPAARPVVAPAPSPAGHDLFPYPTLARAMRRALSDYGEAILVKPPGMGYMGLREALSRYLARNRGIAADASQILIGSGAEYLYGLIVEALGRDKLFGIESPSYRRIEQVYRVKGVDCDLLELGRDGITARALRRTQAQVLHITPFRSYPSGVTASASRRAAYIRWADEGDRVIVEDDCESEFSLMRKPERSVFSLATRGNVIYMNTFSRTISPALRVGYMVLPKRLMPVFDLRVGFYSCTVPVFEQVLLAQLIDSGDFERHINRIRRRERRRARGERQGGTTR